MTRINALLQPKIITVLLLCSLAVAMQGCGETKPQTLATELPQAQFTATRTPLPTQSEQATATFLPIPTILTTATQPALYINATVWATDPQVPILVYHRFIPDTAEQSTAVKIRREDFQKHLQALYDAGYSLVGLESWLKGDLHLASGRRPLILTIDDLFFADQIYLDPNGQPSMRSGLGILWNFYQQHPDFGFAVALFPNMGDKLYGNIETNQWWQNGAGWEDSLAQAVVWCIENGAMPYNHFYTHPLLTGMNPGSVVKEATKNDEVLRTTLERAGQAALISRLGNIIALPYGEWPEDRKAREALVGYHNPEGKALLAVLEVDYAFRAKFLPPPYALEFNRWHVPRIVGTESAIRLLTDRKDEIPVAGDCSLGPYDPARKNEAGYIEGLIQAAYQQNRCPEGIYAVDGQMYRLLKGAIEPLNIHEVGGIQ